MYVSKSFNLIKSKKKKINRIDAMKKLREKINNKSSKKQRRKIRSTRCIRKSKTENPNQQRQ